LRKVEKVERGKEASWDFKRKDASLAQLMLLQGT
jgi:hypothetical protein